MILSWNEIKDRALHFSKEWADTSNEEADAKPFLVEFFNVFGISNRRVSTFEHKVKKLDDRDGYIDLLWKGTILIEMKSKGKNLDKAYSQAIEYTHGLKEHELPKYILISDFEHFRLYDLEENKTVDFKLNELVNNVQHFGYLLGYQKKVYKEQDPANIKAAELMGKLHDRLEEIGYIGHPLEVYLVRLLFCLFAEDTTIFNKQQFQDFIEQRTSADGSDLAAKLQELFQVLNTPADKRFKNLDEQLADFPYVNGKLFEENLPTASFDSKMRQALLECTHIDWSKISPAIFGSMFQSVMNPKERRNIGAHYTSEKNILKLIKPLFLDEFWNEFESIKENKNKLIDFHKKLSMLKFLDPACGCGNFLVITYRELRLLELEILRVLHKSGQMLIDVSSIIKLDVDQFYGIEIEEFPARIAEVAMWLIDHQMNMLISYEFGQYFIRLPLKKAANIVYGDALEIDWQSLLSPLNTIDVVAKHANIYLVNEPTTQFGKVNVQAETFSVLKGKPEVSSEVKFDFIIGNPPFIGSKWMNDIQRANIKQFETEINNNGILDYVAAWYIKAAQYIKNTKIKVAFVSTNSITQGEQAGTLWNPLFNKYKIKIHFAHRTFGWRNEAKGNAAVHVVIIGFACFDVVSKFVYEYNNIKGEPHEVKVKNISPYLIEGPDFAITNRSTPLCNVPQLKTGNKPLDDGNYIFSESEMLDFIDKEPDAIPFFKKYIGSEEFINGNPRYILWLKDAEPNLLRALPLVKERISKVIDFRKSSTSLPTIKLANEPVRFHTENFPTQNFLIIPQVSSERRKYIPIGFEKPGIVCSDKLRIMGNASLYHFSILVSKMHMTWMRTVTGRLKSDYQYSVLIVYNNFPWPEDSNEKQNIAIEAAGQKVLDARLQFPNSSLADLYDPLTMPQVLVRAHNELDKAVDLAYRSQPFTSEANRMEFLFGLYEKYTTDLFTKVKPKRKGTN